MEEVAAHWKEWFVFPIHKGDKMAFNQYWGILPLLTKNRIVSNVIPSRLAESVEKFIEIISVEFDVTVKLYIKNFLFVR